MASSKSCLGILAAVRSQDPRQRAPQSFQLHSAHAACPASPPQMPQEVEKLKANVTDQVEHNRGTVFTFTTGTLGGRPVVFAAANVGTVFAGSAATTMINEFKVSAIVFTGVAGGLKQGQKVGDLLIGKDVVNYEMDVRAFHPPWDPHVYQLGEIPFLKWRFYEADPTMLATALEAPLAHGVELTLGRIATGSIFIDTAAKKAMTSTVWEPLGFPDACEMENAGVAQICKAYGVPYLSLRALSDVVEGDANADFGAFCQQAADNVFPIVQHLAATLVDAVDVSVGAGAKPKGGKPSGEEIEKMKAEKAAQPKKEPPPPQTKETPEEKAAKEAAKAKDKLLKTVIKEGGKKGVEIEGAAEMGGLDFFCTTIESPEGDQSLLLTAMQAMNADPDPLAEERKGCSGFVGKMIFSAGTAQLAIVAYVPKPESNKSAEKVDVTEWIKSVAAAVGGTVTNEKIAAPDTFVNEGKPFPCPHGGHFAEAVVVSNPEAGKYAIKDKDTAMAAAFDYLRKHGAFPEDTGDDEDDMVFGDDDDLSAFD